VHHMNKGKEVNGVPIRAGQRLLGSTTLHGWADSAIYCSRLQEDREGWVRIAVETEFRSMAPQKGMGLAFTMGSPGGMEMTTEWADENVEQRILDLVAESPGMGLGPLAAGLGSDTRTARDRAKAMPEIRVERNGRGRGGGYKFYLAD